MTELSGPRTYQSFQGTYTLPFLIFPRECSVTPGVPLAEKIPCFSFKAFDCHTIPRELALLIWSLPIMYFLLRRHWKGVQKCNKNPGSQADVFFAVPTVPDICGRSVFWSSLSMKGLPSPRINCTNALAGKMGRISFPLIFRRLPGNPMKTN